NARHAVNDIEGGLEALERAVELNPRAQLARLNLARTYRQAGRFDAAEAVLRRMADDFPEDATSLIDLHDLLKILGRDDQEVLSILDLAIAREPPNVTL